MTNGSGVSRILLCSAVVGLSSFQGVAQLNATALRPVLRPAAVEHNGQHDFHFEIGSWKVRLSRLEHPLTGSTTWHEYEGRSVVRKVWDGRANLGELDVDGPAGHIEGLTLRLYNAQSRQWNITWANAHNGV